MPVVKRGVNSIAKQGSVHIKGDATLSEGTGVTLTQSGQDIEIAASGGGSGTVTSVAQTVPTGFTVSGSPVTTTGTLAIAYDTGYQGYTTTEANKLSNIEASADVTDTTNVTAAGALMDSEVTNLAQVKAFDSADYATAAQGALADSATQPGDLATVATTGAYADLSGTPTIPTVSDTAYDATSWNGNTDAPTKNAVRDKIESMGSGGLANVVEDITPQLGGDLETNGNDIVFSNNDALKAGTTNGDSLLIQAYAASAASYLTVLDANSTVTTEPTATLNYISTINGVSAPTAQFTTADESKLDGIEAGADVTDATNVAAAGAYMSGGTDVALADGGTGASLTDPNADRIMFWDDSAGAVTWLTASTGLTLSGTSLTARAASETVTGISERATTTEASTGTDTTRHVTPAGLTAFLNAKIGSTVQAYDADLTNWAGKTAPSGDAVGTTDTQTLTNKTIDGASNTLTNIPQASISATCAFRARRSTTYNLSSTSTIVFNTEDYDYGANYNPATGIFTAPVNGIYRVTCNIDVSATSTNRAFMEFITSGTGASANARGRDATTTFTGRINDSWEGYLPSGGTIYVQAYSATSTNISSTETYFAGSLVAAV